MTAVDVLPDQAGDRNSFGILAEFLFFSRYLFKSGDQGCQIWTIVKKPLPQTLLGEICISQSDTPSKILQAICSQKLQWQTANRTNLIWQNQFLTFAQQSVAISSACPQLQGLQQAQFSPSSPGSVLAQAPHMAKWLNPCSPNSEKLLHCLHCCTSTAKRGIKPTMERSLMGSLVRFCSKILLWFQVDQSCVSKIF